MDSGNISCRTGISISATDEILLKKREGQDETEPYREIPLHYFKNRDSNAITIFLIIMLNFIDNLLVMLYITE